MLVWGLPAPVAILLEASSLFASDLYVTFVMTVPRDPGVCVWVCVLYPRLSVLYDVCLPSAPSVPNQNQA